VRVTVGKEQGGVPDQAAAGRNRPDEELSLHQ
jgi:hypothetical protein